MEETHTTGDIAPALSARFTPEDAQYQVLMQRLFAKNETLAEDKRRLEEKDQHQVHLMTNVGNELRSPLSSIVGLGALLNDGSLGDLNQAQQECIRGILHGGDAMLRTLSDLLVWSQLESRTFELHRSRLSLTDLLHCCVRRLRPSLDAKRQEIEVTLDLPLPELVADGARLEQAICNLLDNASKFTPTGGCLRLLCRRPDADEIVIEVADNGIGLACSDRERLFDRHAQIQGQHARRTGGTGLGLAVTRHIVEQHGGSMSVDSALEVGSTFRLHLPL